LQNANLTRVHKNCLVGWHTNVWHRELKSAHSPTDSQNSLSKLTVGLYYYTTSQKVATIFIMKTSTNIDQFSQLFHC